MKDSKVVLLIGVGLIGGSVALAIKQEHDAKVIGYDVNMNNCKLAEKLGIIDKYTETYEDIVQTADLIVLSCPVEIAEKFLEELAKLPLKKDVIITDVGSTKARIMEKADALFGHSNAYIGGHPMAGSHKAGPGSAKAHLFENAYYVLTPSQGANGRVAQLKEWLKGTKAHFIIMDPKQHDLVTGVVSHFPHVVAASLVRQVQGHAAQDKHIQFLAAGGFRDITRIASSSPVMWRDIVQHNQPILIGLLEEWLDEMTEVKRLIESGDAGQIYDYFDGAKKFRDSLPVRAKGAITSFYDLYVDVLDKTGVISDITTILAKKSISITNIRIIEAREDVYGVLRISFQTEEDMESAKQSLEGNGYETYISM